MRTQTIAGRLKTSTNSRQVGATISTEVADRQGDIVRAKGCDHAGFAATGCVLWNHDQAVPVARCVSVSVGPSSVYSVAEFPPAGVSAKADEVYGLVKAGIVNAVSIGFLPLETVPLGKGALDVIRWTLLEWSFVTVPANDQALITSRAFEMSDDEAQLGRALDVMALGGPGLNPSHLSGLDKDHQRRLRQLEATVLGGRL